MAETALVETRIKAGAELLQLLDAAFFGPIFAALWFRHPEAEDWHFVIGSDLVDREGPLAASRRLLDALHGYSWEAGISLLDLYVVGRRDPLVEALPNAPRITGAAEPVHISSALVGGSFIEDAYLYRNTWDGADASVARVASR